MENTIKEILEENDCLTADGFDDAIIGFQQKDGHVMVVYSINKCIYSLMENDNMGYQEAEEFLHFNTINCYMGVKTPIFIKTYYNG
tara:strand:+ start:213 stop:470 length:258 start_codon:yes stop_codon:yes gene_type:complete